MVSVLHQISFIFSSSLRLLILIKNKNKNKKEKENKLSSFLSIFFLLLHFL